MEAGPKLDPEREQAILGATLDLLAETGYEALRLDAVASRAKASKATLYRHWPGKAELVVDAIQCYEQADLAKNTDTGSLRGDLLATLSGIRDLLTGDLGQLMAGLLAALQKDADLAAAVRSSMVEDKQQINRQMLDRAIARGELPADTDPNVVPEVAPAVLFMRIFVNGESVDDDFLAHLTDDILIPLMVRSR
ncbi:TetR/AcrR family transcriptional regulator [Catenulispora sp. NF23]|uniref:TetR/AcrR family transcriptional regulator n=1 Tax=Catenulispora pinistramenti TaxID=2705254 RepID=A0ABS5L393_9ACTN|nr:TetR/AcrR family transcriptional regulator [Catenulispora pinistramenti]MBS2540008.1 TetR/AcrR family transcriptional regulator [Catenulispora pinistramenti]MBS2552818.1 TetR/AcrR family transcriptional regulator [Catenulispora pinistramenti]